MSDSPQLALLDALPEAVFVLTANGALRYANPACGSLFGWNLNERVGRSLLDQVHPDDLAQTLQTLAMHSPDGPARPRTFRLASNGGDWKNCELSMVDATVGGQIGGSLVLARDTNSGSDNANLMKVVVEHSTAALAVMERDGKLRSLNSGVTRQLGYRPDQFDGTAFSKCIADPDRQRVLREVGGLASNQSATMDAVFIKGDGAQAAVELTITNLVEDPDLGGYLIAAQPSSGRNASDADHDALTGLLNRKGFDAEAKARLGALANSGQRIQLLLFEVDRAAQINDLLGEAVGDRVISLVASRLRLAVRFDDILARVGDDEFALATVANADTALMLKERLLSVVAQAMNIDGHELGVTAVAAIASSAGTLSMDAMFDEASGRLKAHKASSTNPATSASALAERRTVVEQLRLAVERDELTPWFQPIVDQFGTVMGYEALIRWQHPLRGVLTPGHFLPLITLAGLDQHLEEIVLRRSLEFSSRLVDRGNDFMIVHINITPRQLSNEDFGRRFLQSAERADVPLSGLCVEITESDLLNVGASAINNLSMLRRAGVHVAIDDFGTGYSSLSHLLELPTDCLKIDRRFVEGVGLDPMATGLTKAILSLTESMGIGCVAEGVELQVQHDKLVEFGCPQFQGWLYSPALSADEALTWVCSEMLDYH